MTLLVAVLGCIAALEVAFNSGVDANEQTEAGAAVKRQETTTPSPEFTILTSTPESTITTSIVPSSVVASSADPTSFILISTPTTTGPTTSPSTSNDLTFSADPTSFLTIETLNPVTTTSRDTSRVTAASADRGSFITTDRITTTSRTTQTSDLPVTVDTPTSDVLDLTVITVTPETTTPQTITSQETITSDGSTFTRGSTIILTSDTPSVVTLAVSPTLLTTVIEGSTAVISTSTTVAAPTASSQPSPAVKASQVQITKTFEGHDYFLSSYLAILIAVTLKLTWGLVFSGLKMLEPFFQLSKNGGASASESLLADYLSAAYGWNHIRHIFSGHWVMLFSTLCYLAMAALSPIASETMGITATEMCPTSGGGLQPCTPVWVLNKGPGRTLEGMLIFIAVLILLVIVFNFRRTSGIFSNPSSIATMASLLSHDDMIQELRQIDAGSSDKSILAALSGTRYTLMSYTDSAGIPRYGITKNTSSSESNSYSLASERNFDALSRPRYAAVSNPNNMTLQEHPITEQKPFSVSWRWVRDVSFLLVIFALFGIVLAYYVVGNHSDFNNWFNSGAFGPKFTLTSIAALIDFLWKTIEREVRILVPYRRLGARQAAAERSVLVDIGGVPISSLWSALRRGEVFHSVVAFTAILSDLLLIAVGGVPFSHGAVWDAYLYSSYISLAILAWMALVMFGVFWWRSQIRQLRMPREPDTILSIWLMMADEGNGVLKEYSGWETTRGGERDRAAIGRGTRYWGGWTKGESSIERWCIGVEGVETTLLGYDYATTGYR